MKILSFKQFSEKKRETVDLSELVLESLKIRKFLGEVELTTAHVSSFFLGYRFNLYAGFYFAEIGLLITFFRGKHILERFNLS